LAHPYLEAYVRVFGSQSVLFLICFGQQHDPDDEPVAPPLDPEFFEFDRQFNLVCDACHELTFIVS
jgi:mitogen-activated protein kinase 1/3